MIRNILREKVSNLSKLFLPAGEIICSLSGLERKFSK